VEARRAEVAEVVEEVAEVDLLRSFSPSRSL
jgi:hypothetical protein